MTFEALRGKSITLRHAALALGLLFLLPNTVRAAEAIRFPTFGFGMTVPHGIERCAPFDNGIAMYIDGKSGEPNCGVKPDRRMIIVSALVNDELPGANHFAAQHCAYLEHRWESFLPAEVDKYSVMMPVPSLELGGRASWSCQLSSNDGEDLFVATRCVPRSQPLHQLEIDCSAWLHTQDKEYDKDLTLFRQLIASVEFFPPVPGEQQPLDIISTAGLCPTILPGIPEDGAAYSIKDPRSGLILQLESDRRRITAFDTRGKMVWQANPFVDAKLQPYRTSHPVIVQLGVLPNCAVRSLANTIIQDHFISIGFNSSQSGLLNAKTGHFIFMGQD
ncbi:MAG: hypothetical protein HY243_19320 [Proteobacteria bacterium]|nr:hypothetical protein [Pseudomonadota bacterium]